MRRLLYLILFVGVVACTDRTSDPGAAVGRRHYAWTDSARTAWDGTGSRPLAVTLWYPAVAASVAEQWSADVFRFGRSARDADVAANGRRPLVLLSHGTGGSAAQLAWFAERLAQEGFVVAGVNHHGNTATEDTNRPHGFVLPHERARDLSVTLDLLLADSKIAANIDSTRIGAAGFSLGGYTVLALAGARLSSLETRQAQCAAAPERPDCVLPPEANFTFADVDSLAMSDVPFMTSAARAQDTWRDTRIRALFLMAPALTPWLDRESLRDVSAPMLVVFAGRDQQVDAEETSGWFSEQLPHAEIMSEPDAGHYAFLAECTLRGRLTVRPLCSDGGRSRAALHERTARVAAAFLRAQLTASVPRVN